MQLIIQPDEITLLDVQCISSSIVVVPMVCDEHDNQLLSQLKKGSGQFPKWNHLKEKNYP